MSMEIADSNKRYSVIIAGILVIMTVAIFVTFTLGVMEQKAFSDNGTHPIMGDVSYISRNITSESFNIKECDNLVSGSNRGCDIKMKTEPGAIKVEYKVLECYELPICFDTKQELDEFNNALNITVSSWGGYKPNTVSYLNLTQEWCTLPWGGLIDIDWELLPKQPNDPCSLWRWKAVFNKNYVIVLK